MDHARRSEVHHPLDMHPQCTTPSVMQRPSRARATLDLDGHLPYTIYPTPPTLDHLPYTTYPRPSRVPTLQPVEYSGQAAH